jgi:hypothetical protein
MLSNYQNKHLVGYQAKQASAWFVIGSGPSLTAEDVASLHGQRVICINDNYLRAPWADVLYACDGHWWDWHAHRPELQNFKGRKITQDEDAAKRYRLEHIASVDRPGLSKDPAYIHQGQNSGIQAINLAYHFGATRIVLLGFDMQDQDGVTHWFGSHPDGSAPKWRRLMPLFESVAEDARRMGIEIVNATRQTALTCFPRIPLSSLLPARA